MIDFLVGALLGSLHFGGLLLTLKRRPWKAGHQAFSLAARFTLTAAGLAWLALRGPGALAAGLLGLLAARGIFLWKGGGRPWSSRSTT